MTPPRRRPRPRPRSATRPRHSEIGSAPDHGPPLQRHLGEGLLGPLRPADEGGPRRRAFGTCGARRWLRASGRTIDVGSRHGWRTSSSTRTRSPSSSSPSRTRTCSRGCGRRCARAGLDAEVVEAPAEALPFEDSSVDTVVFTLVLCTVPDPAAALAETARVLKPGGKLLFVEHVRSKDPGAARWQDRLEGPWRFFADGCHCNRDTVSTIEAAGFTLEGASEAELPKAPPLIRPAVLGSATLRA